MYNDPRSKPGRFSWPTNRHGVAGSIFQRTSEEVTGGDSFCYVDIREWGGVKDSVRAGLLQKGLDLYDGGNRKTDSDEKTLNQ